jgi:guanylate kinase|tara:strand:+ start:174 stop:797 length:624 start_codon:yes stop_codon:yes gene_type:complete
LGNFEINSEVTLENQGIKDPLIIIVSGPSGVGKDTILNNMKKITNFYFPITVTTRPIRKNEKNGIDYKFISINLFKNMIIEKKFIEWAQVYEHYYGVPKSEIQYAKNKNLDIILKTDIQGAFTIKEIIPESITIFLSPPNIKELSNRLNNRKTEDKISLEKRLQTSEYEMNQSSKFDYNIVNKTGKINLTIDKIIKIIDKEIKHNIL